MTLYEIVNKLKDIAKKQPNINYVGEGDIYTLNSLPNIDYSVFFVTQTTHRQRENTLVYTLYLYYIDRLFTDECNTLDVQSNGIVALENIINTLYNGEDITIDGEITYNTFTHRFADACAGVYATVNIVVDNNLGICSY